MRTIITQGFTITYPDQIIWLFDNNKIRIEGTNTGYNTKITIRNPYGETSNLEYTTRTNTITFFIDDNIRWLWQKGNGEYLFSITIDEVQIFSFSCKVLNGKSFLNKTHGSSNVIYLYNTDSEANNQIEVFSPAAGRVVVGDISLNVDSGLNLVYLPLIGIDRTGVYDILLTNRRANSITATITSDKGIKPNISNLIWFYELDSNDTVIDGGTLFEPRQVFPQTLKLHYLDPCVGDVVLRYTNADGCIRQIAGKLIEEKDEFEPTRLNNVIKSETYKYNPTFVNNNNKKILKIGCYDMEAGCELNDIIFSDMLQILDINNEWTDCILQTNTVTNFRNNGYDNLEFEIIISEL